MNLSTIGRYFSGSILVSVLGLMAAGGIGYFYSGHTAGLWTAVFSCCILSVLEISLSFDNAVVNAKVLNKMTDLWRHRFLTWGMLIAVFGMRLVFPLAIVALVAKVNPWEALVLAATRPDEYARIMLDAHIPVAAFGGSFLLMVALKYFFDANKEVHWIHALESLLVRIGKLESIHLALALVLIYMVSRCLSPTDSLPFIWSSIFGLITFIAVDGLSAYLEGTGETNGNEDSGSRPSSSSSSISDLHRASAGMFLYLEVLDASFSFDGVVGAFAITTNLFIIGIGLGIGAMFVRSLTILMVDKGTLAQFRYLEHGAFYAIGALAVIMFLNTFMHISEVITGLIGAFFIGLSVVSSIGYARRHK